MPKRKEFIQVQKLIYRLSRREFAGMSALSGNNEMMKALIENLVMLGEELNESTVSKEYFQNIFNSVPEAILILDNKGKIITGNQTMNAIQKKVRKTAGSGSFFNDLFESEKHKDPFRFLRKGLINGKSSSELKVKVKDITGRVFICKLDRLQSEQNTIRFLALINEITELENYQALLLDSASKYRQLFSDSSDAIFLFDTGGKLIEMNDAMRILLKQEQLNWQSLNIFNYIKPHNTTGEHFLTRLKNGQPVTNMEVQLKTSNNTPIECLFSCNPVFEKKSLTSYQGMLKNISQYKEYNAMLMRAMGEFQENERKRIATDLHDSLGQQLSGIKFMLSSLAGMNTDAVQKPLLQQMNADVFQVIEDLRKICFDLMPDSLEKFGLVKTIEELLGKMRRAAPEIFFNLNVKKIPPLPRAMEVNIYRIVQEFVNNSLKYAACKKINILMAAKKSELQLILEDDGKGMDKDAIDNSKGMGLNNILSRTRSFNGTVNIQSKKNAGTTFIIKIPLSI